MKTYEDLVKENPDLSGSQIIELFKQQEKAVAEKNQEIKEKLQREAKDFNENGAFFKGSNGRDIYYYKITNVRTIGFSYNLGDVKVISLDDMVLRSRKHTISIQSEVLKDENLSKYALSQEQRITEDVYNNVMNAFSELYKLMRSNNEDN